MKPRMTKIGANPTSEEIQREIGFRTSNKMKGSVSASPAEEGIAAANWDSYFAAQIHNEIQINRMILKEEGFIKKTLERKK